MPKAHGIGVGVLELGGVTKRFLLLCDLLLVMKLTLG